MTSLALQPTAPDSENPLGSPKRGEGDKEVVWPGLGGLHCDLRELLLGQVQGLAQDGDAILLRVPVRVQAGS